MAIEEPQYDLINKSHSYEIRMYKERLAAQTIKNSGSDRAFMRLFDYISHEYTAGGRMLFYLNCDDGWKKQVYQNIFP